MNYKIVNTILFIVNISLTILITNITRVNSFSTGILICFTLLPLLLLQGIIAIDSFFARRVKIHFVMSIIITCIVCYWFIEYVFIGD